MRQFRPADLLSLRTVSDATLAPAGDEFAYALRDPVNGSALWRGFEGTGEARPLTRGPHDRLPRYAPDGSQIAFLRGPEGAAQIYLLDRKGGEAMAFTRLRHGVRDFAWAPDGRAIAVVASTGPEGPLPLRDGEHALAAPESAHRALLLLQLDGTWRALSPDTVDCAHPVFSPSGRHIAALAKSGGGDACLALVPTDGGPIRCIVESAFKPGPATFSVDGSHLAFAARPRGTARTGLFTAPVDGGEPVLHADSLPDGLWLSAREAPVYAPDGRSVFVLAREEGMGRLAEVRADGALRLRTPDDADTRSFCLDETGARIALVVEDALSPAHFALRDAAGRLLVRSRHDHPPLAAVRRSTPVRLALAAGGAASIYLPEEDAPTALVAIPSETPHAFSALAQVLTAQGFATITAPAGFLAEAWEAAVARFPHVAHLPIGIAAQGEAALQDLSFLDRAAAAVFTNLPGPLPLRVGGDSTTSAFSGHILHLSAGGRTHGDAIASSIAKEHVFLEERGAAEAWTAKAQAERVRLEVEWLIRYLAR